MKIFPFQRRLRRMGSHGTQAMTILELAVVMVILAILASILLPAYGALMSRTEETRCLANLKSLYVAASGYLQANNTWPQIPGTLINSDPTTYATSWVNALQPYGAPHISWICPTLQKKFSYTIDQIDLPANYRIDYSPTIFNSNPMTPRLADGHPWFIEKFGSHSRGNLMILANGTSAALSDYTSGLSGN
jgi:type II secretory pathway pseudopilin PulG